MKKKSVPLNRSEIMSRIKGKNTSIEKTLRRELWGRGLRYRLQCKDIPGKPDICFRKHKVAVFCDSEFWHGKDYLEGKCPKSNQEYWIPKLERNIRRDREVNKMLEDEGWEVIRFWGKDILENPKGCADSIEKRLKTTTPNEAERSETCQTK